MNIKVGNAPITTFNNLSRIQMNPLRHLNSHSKKVIPHLTLSYDNKKKYIFICYKKCITKK